MELQDVSVDTDDLTGVLSRRAFHTLLQSRTQGFSVVHVDIDHFTQVNMLFGEQVADQLLRCIAARLEEYAGVRGRCARLGSDEFAVVLHDVHEDDLEGCCLDLMALLQQAVVVDSVTLYPQLAAGAVSHGFGVAFTAVQSTELLQKTQIALQHARNQDYPRYSIYNAVQRHIWQNRAYIELQLLQAIHDGDMTVAFQPIVDVANGQVEGFEALARWTLPDGRSSSPAQFIPIAEKNGSIIALGMQIFSAAIREFANLSLLAGAPLKLHLNVSARQLADPELCSNLLQLLAAYNLQPSQLVVELTESQVAQQFDKLISVMRQVKAAGIGIALDDFGTGFSSLSYIASLPLDVIKIDRSFIVSADASEEALCIMRAIVGLAKSLGIKTVAEGVELPGHIALIKREACDFVQGYFSGKPMTAQLCRQYLRDGLQHRVIRGIRAAQITDVSGRVRADACSMHCRNLSDG